MPYQKGIEPKTFFYHSSSKGDIKTLNISSASNDPANTAESQNTGSVSLRRAMQAARCSTIQSPLWPWSLRHSPH